MIKQDLCQWRWSCGQLRRDTPDPLGAGDDGASNAGCEGQREVMMAARPPARAG